MVREEIRLLRVDLRKRQEEVLFLNLELEEAYIELDAIGVLSMEAIEGMYQVSSPHSTTPHTTPHHTTPSSSMHLFVPLPLTPLPPLTPPRPPSSSPPHPPSYRSPSKRIEHRGTRSQQHLEQTHTSRTLSMEDTQQQKECHHATAHEKICTTCTVSLGVI